MNWRCVFLISFVLGFALPNLDAAERRPNVVVILSDDQGWGDLSINGNTNLSTPRIDSLGKDGAMLDRFFVCPVCSPTRAEFLTGRYAARVGVFGTSTGQERLNTDETTIAQSFKAAGYATGAFGKWHSGSQAPYHPNDRGFDEFYGFTSGHWGQYFDPDLEYNGKPVKAKGYIADILTDKAIEFIDKQKGSPFFCYVPYNTPHSPLQVPDEYYQKFANEELKLRDVDPAKEDLAHTKAVLAMCENLDANVGRILDKLKALDLEKDTIVLYFCDNGPNGRRWNGGMKGRKASVDEGGVRSPFLIRWPGKIEAGRHVKEIAGAIDLYATLTALADVPILPGQAMDGRSLKPLLLGEAKEWEDREIISMQASKKNQVSVRNQRFRLDPAGALFDMEADPGQQQDVAEAHPDDVNYLTKVKDQYLQEVTPILEAAAGRPFTVGYADYTTLPARDGVPHGNIQRSAKAPNCSYFTNWKSADDSITWDIAVGERGWYDVSVYYTCAAENVGMELEASFQDNSVKKVVADAHDPPAIGEADDRAPRGTESYVKSFRRLNIGKLQMSQTRGLLTLKSPALKGGEGIEVRSVTLEKVGTDDFELEPGFVSLFNGTDLTGWCYRTKEGDVTDTFDGKAASIEERYTAEDGILTVNPPKDVPRLVARIWTQKTFPKNFVLRLEFRADVNADSGIFVRKPQLQCRDYSVAGPYFTLMKYQPQNWNQIEVIVKDGKAACTCNGELLEGAMPLPPDGPIGLEGDRGKMEYRRIRIKELD